MMNRVKGWGLREVIIVLTVVTFFLLAIQGITILKVRSESNARKAFDDQRAYEICVAGNDRIEDINERFDRLDQLLVSFGDPDDPRVFRFLKEEEAAALKPRECTIRPQNSAGPQR